LIHNRRVRYALPQPYEDVDHTADVGVVVRGRDEAETMARLALALSALLAGGGAVAAAHEARVQTGPGDHATMAIDLLRELLFRFATEQEIAAEVEVVRFDPERGAELACRFGPFDEVAHEEGGEIKAVTWHEARFEREGDGWVAQIIFDV
jgi:SHS2 domain-containing protein